MANEWQICDGLKRTGQQDEETVLLRDPRGFNSVRLFFGAFNTVADCHFQQTYQNPKLISGDKTFDGVYEIGDYVTIDLSITDFSELEQKNGKIFRYDSLLFNNQMVSTTKTVFLSTPTTQFCKEEVIQIPSTYVNE